MRSREEIVCKCVREYEGGRWQEKVQKKKSEKRMSECVREESVSVGVAVIGRLFLPLSVPLTLPEPSRGPLLFFPTLEIAIWKVLRQVRSGKVVRDSFRLVRFRSGQCFHRISLSVLLGENLRARFGSPRRNLSFFQLG